MRDGFGCLVGAEVGEYRGVGMGSSEGSMVVKKCNFLERIKTLHFPYKTNIVKNLDDPPTSNPYSVLCNTWTTPSSEEEQFDGDF